MRCSPHAEPAKDNVQELPQRPMHRSETRKTHRLPVHSSAFCKHASLAVFYSVARAVEKTNPTLLRLVHIIKAIFRRHVRSIRNPAGTLVGLYPERHASVSLGT